VSLVLGYPPAVSLLSAEDRVLEVDGTKHRDYILLDYQPLCDPRGRLHSATAFKSTLRHAAQLEATWPLVEALRAHLGPDNTVWGIKYGPRGVSSELYFYNNRANPAGHPMQVGTLARVLAPFIDIAGTVDETLPYFMCSIGLDVDVLVRRRPEPFRIYLGTGERGRTASGFSFRATQGSGVLENHYAFYYANQEKDLADARQRISHSPRAGGKAALAALMPDYLLDCRTVCYSVKPDYDGLYFSRLRTEQLLRFLAEHLPGTLHDVLSSAGSGFAHLLWDLGFDFRGGAAGQTPAIEKIGVYGVV
jgi:hypothetical protein